MDSKFTLVALKAFKTKDFFDSGQNQGETILTHFTFSKSVTPTLLFLFNHSLKSRIEN